MGQSSMGRRLLRLDGDEQDALTGWRHFLRWGRGAKAAIKRQYRRRERQESKRELRDYRYDR